MSVITREREEAPEVGDVYVAKVDGSKGTVVKLWRPSPNGAVVPEEMALLDVEGGGRWIVARALLGKRGLTGWRLAKRTTTGGSSCSLTSDR